MKLVKILGKEMSEWPKGFEDVGQARDGVLHLPGIGNHVRHTKERYTQSEDWDGAIVTRAQWQAERDRQKGGEWKRHRGGKCPVDGKALVEYRLRDGHTYTWTASSLDWSHTKVDGDVMSYRVISQPQAEEVEVNVFVGKDVKIEYAYAQEGVEPEHLEWKTMGTAKIDSICDLGSTEAKTDQIDGPIKWRDTVNELDAYIEEFTREREALINRLALEGFGLIPAMAAVIGVADVDMSDWRNWKDGDLITFTQESEADFTKGKQYVFESYESQEHEISIAADDIGDPNGWKPEFFEWHSRP